MARLIHAGEFATEGEARAAEALRSLPDDWIVICNKTLVTRSARSFEIDFLVLGDHYVFAIDEKSWRGRIHGSDQLWVRSDGSSETSPLSKITYIANVLAGELRAKVAHLRDVRDHFVQGMVLLSAAEELPRIRDPRADDGVALLEGIGERLTRFDQGAQHQALSPFRPAIERVLVDFSDRPRFPTKIASYKIEEILSQRPHLYVARAIHEQAGPRTLFVYRLTGAAEGLRTFYLREFEAVRALQATGLTPEVLDPFPWSEDFLVVPFAPPLGKALGALKAPDDLAGFTAELPIAAAAFDSLGRVHQGGVVHRALSPDTIFVQPSVREPKTTFTGFHAARVEGPASIAAQLDDLAVEDPYAAPELAVSYGLATVESDVFSLALVFLERLSGLRPAECRALAGTDALRAHLGARWSQLPAQAIDALAEVFQIALRPGPMAPADMAEGRRLNAEGCASRLRAILRMLQTTAAEESGALLDGRYRVRRKLGQGASGTTYLVEDEAMDPAAARAFVVKAFHHPEAIRAQASREFDRLREIHSPYIVRIYDFYPPENTVHLKMDYVPGPTLAEVQKEFPWPEARWWRFAEGLLSALEVLEQHLLRHRDLKPDNIVLRAADDVPVLIDFSFAVAANSPEAPAGSIGYLPPEAPSASQPPESSDRYAVAVILHQALTGRRPGDLVPTDLQEVTTARLRHVLLRAVDADPTLRFANAVEFRQALEAARRAPEILAPSAADNLVRQINPWVDAVRGLYRDSATGNADNRGLDSEFARVTYVPTALDERLLPAILRDRPPAVFLSGNPGDGKTAFLERVRDALEASGAVKRQQDPSGWEYVLDGHTFRSCYDASESHGELSADAQLEQRLQGLEGDSDPRVPLTVLVAINDGRLADFFARHEETFLWLALWVRSAAANPDVGGVRQPWVIDLKRRAFVDIEDVPAQPSVFQRVLDTLVAPEPWDVCGTCVAQPVCPMLANATALRGEDDQATARRRLERTVALTHLRREFHTTMRDLRSTLAYLVTANLSCEQIHEAREGVAPAEVLGAQSRFWQRCFTPPAEADDLLIALGRLDPARSPRPRLDRYLVMNDDPDETAQRTRLFFASDPNAPSETNPTHYASELEWLAAMKRRLFFHGIDTDIDGLAFDPGAVFPYRFAQRFLQALRGEAELDGLRTDLARGVTRSDGIAAEILGDTLCVRMHANEQQQLAVLKQFPLEDFSVRVIRPPRSGLVESIPEVLELRYRDGTPTLVLELDMFELLLRFADGVRATAPEYAPLKEDLAPFKNSLILAATDELVLLEAERRVHRITQRNGKIVRLGAV